MVQRKERYYGRQSSISWTAMIQTSFLSTNELATLIGFRPKTIRRWVSRKFLRYIRVGNRFRFRLAAVELFLAQREVRK
jgi:excisionase family DNA binding protein